VENLFDLLGLSVVTNSSSNSSSGNNRKGQVSLVDGPRWWWCYRLFRNRFFLSRLSREVDEVEVEVSSRLCDWWATRWWGGEFNWCDWWALP